MGRILIIDDNQSLGDGLVLSLNKMGHQAVAVGSGREGLARMQDELFDLVITDYRMEEMDGLAVMEAVQRQAPDTDVMMMTAYDTRELAVEAMERGAIDFIAKPFSPDELWLKVDKWLDYRTKLREAQTLHHEAETKLREAQTLHHEAETKLREWEHLSEQNYYLQEEVNSRYNFGEIIGDSRPMQAVMAQVRRVASSESSVLIYGESGTGKEVVARAIHYQSSRSKGPFVRVNCGALPVGLVESELFGHEQGAFTGAVRTKKGRFELAEGGTVFLDEIGDVPLDTQVRLLRVLQEKQFDRVGGEQTLDVDVRIVAATNRQLKQMVAEGTFREDLFYRLEVIPLTLPPLRERANDIGLLARHFIFKKCREMNIPLKRLTPEALACLAGYRWPGNVRELENVIERTIVLAEGKEIGSHDLPLALEGAAAEGSLPLDERGGDMVPLALEGVERSLLLNERLDAVERDLIARAMEEADHVKTKAASLLGIKTSALYYKLEKYGLD